MLKVTIGPIGIFQALADNGGVYLVGDSLTLADLGLFESLMNVDDYFGPGHLDDYPLLMVNLEKTTSLV